MQACITAASLSIILSPSSFYPAAPSHGDLLLFEICNLPFEIPKGVPVAFFVILPYFTRKLTADRSANPVLGTHSLAPNWLFFFRGHERKTS